MCLISLIAFETTFKSHPIKSNPNDFFSNKIMAPRFKDLIKLSGESYTTLSKESYEDISIKSAEGFSLKGYFFKNKVETNNTAILVHGYQSTAFNDNSGHALKFLNEGYNVLLIDNRGCGKSEGKYISFGVYESEDLALWCKLIADRYPNGNIVLQGTSLGGATVSMASALDLPKEVKCIISDCAFIDMNDEFTHMVKKFFHIPTWPAINCMEGWAKKIAGFDFSTKSPLNSVKNAKLPILFIHGEEDAFIDKSSAQILYDACKSEKDILFVKGCGHAQAQLAAETYYDKAFSFINKYFI